MSATGWLDDDLQGQDRQLTERPLEAQALHMAAALPDATHITIVASRADAATAATKVDLAPQDAVRQ